MQAHHELTRELQHPELRLPHVERYRADRGQLFRCIEGPGRRMMREQLAELGILRDLRDAAARTDLALEQRVQQCLDRAGVRQMAEVEAHSSVPRVVGDGSPRVQRAQWVGHA